MFKKNRRLAFTKASPKQCAWALNFKFETQAHSIWSRNKVVELKHIPTLKNLKIWNTDPLSFSIKVFQENLKDFQIRLNGVIF